jgi:hypothetical protein
MEWPQRGIQSHQYHDDIRIHRSFWAQGSVPRELFSAAQVQCKQLQAAATKHAVATVSIQAAAAAAQDAQLEDAHRRLTRAAEEAGLVGTLLRSAAAELSGFAASQAAAELRIALADSVPRAFVEFERQVRTLLIPTQQCLSIVHLLVPL